MSLSTNNNALPPFVAEAKVVRADKVDGVYQLGVEFVVVAELAHIDTDYFECITDFLSPAIPGGDLCRASNFQRDKRLTIYGWSLHCLSGAIMKPPKCMIRHIDNGLVNLDKRHQ